MNIQSPFSAGLQGYQRAADSVTDASLNISRANVNTLANESQARPEVNPDQFVDASKKTMTDNLVQLKEAELHAQANVKSIKTADGMLGTLIDIRV
ncbi:flagellar biosynthesis protein FlgE [Oceanisphaera pacifica]|uniref:Flagellar biosynthesis protein FlgE n=1 Tax=Oceanisphaera pacifica TaxID=2818389 RepID=A0ABS3NIQ9_9GAMM|nr:flagellar biosynthesis protein FlgE [Oceanisphaera pacifica]MBO1520111.1 flagellar biosynthesis protein FlgE [Oceanisphaera pacifica]